MKSENLLRILLSALFVSFSMFGIGQSGEKAGQDLGAPGEEHKVLNALAGSWNATVKFPVGKGREAEGQASCKGEWVLDGRFLKMEYSSTFFGKPLTILRYIGFDRHRKKYTEIQFESTHTDVMHTEGAISDDKSIITCFGSHIDASTGKEVKVRSVTTFLDKDSFTLQLFYGEGDDAKTITLIHKRNQQ